jgi:hypothetical protein
MIDRSRALTLGLLALIGAVGMATEAPAQVPPQAQDASACKLATPAEGSFKAGPVTGAYAGLELPRSLQPIADSEVRVTAGIYRIFLVGKDWPCFQKFYPAAAKTFKERVKAMGGG